MAERRAAQLTSDAQAEAERIISEAQAQAAAASTAPRADNATVELLGEMRAIRTLLQAALQPGGPLAPRPPSSP